MPVKRRESARAPCRVAVRDSALNEYEMDSNGNSMPSIGSHLPATSVMSVFPDAAYRERYAMRAIMPRGDAHGALQPRFSNPNPSIAQRRPINTQPGITRPQIPRTIIVGPTLSMRYKGVAMNARTRKHSAQSTM